jgi:hypothetical protein
MEEHLEPWSEPHLEVAVWWEVDFDWYRVFEFEVVEKDMLKLGVQIDVVEHDAWDCELVPSTLFMHNAGKDAVIILWHGPRLGEQIECEADAMQQRVREVPDDQPWLWHPKYPRTWK